MLLAGQLCVLVVENVVKLLLVLSVVVDCFAASLTTADEMAVGVVGNS